MSEIDAKALFVRDGERIGVITKTDLADAAILERLPIEAPVASSRNTRSFRVAPTISSRWRCCR